MIQTKDLRLKQTDTDGKLTILTTNKVKPREIRLDPDRWQGVNKRDTKKLPVKMLTTENMTDIKQNEKRKELMAKLKAIRQPEEMVDLIKPVPIIETITHPIEPIADIEAETITDAKTDEYTIAEIARKMGATVVKKKRERKRKKKDKAK